MTASKYEYGYAKRWIRSLSGWQDAAILWPRHERCQADQGEADAIRRRDEARAKKRGNHPLMVHEATAMRQRELPANS
jgi:hypothetical protein